MANHQHTITCHDVLSAITNEWQTYSQIAKSVQNATGKIVSVGAVSNIISGHKIFKEKVINERRAFGDEEWQSRMYFKLKP